MNRTNLASITSNLATGGTWETYEIGEYTELTIRLIIPTFAINKLNKYGWDYIRNINEYIKQTYFAICASERKQKKKPTTK